MEHLHLPIAEKAKTASQMMNHGLEALLLEQINKLERKAQLTPCLIEATLYLQLADIYHERKAYADEEAILTRFANFEFAHSESLIEVFDRLQHLHALCYSIESHSSVVSLQQETPENDRVSVAIPAHYGRMQQEEIKVITIGAALTGFSERDECYELALVLFSFKPKSETPFKILQTYTGFRKPRHLLPEKQKAMMGKRLNQNVLDRQKVIRLFEQADFAVSHGHAEAERHALITLMPELVDMPWHSSQTGIPWGALGYASNRLQDLSKMICCEVPKDCLGRAKAIYYLLQEKESFAQHTLCERLYFNQPMSSFFWSRESLKQSKRLNPSKYNGFIWTLAASVMLVTTALSLLF